MGQRYRPSPGTPLEELDTPCLIVDMDALESNMKVMSDYYRDRTCKLRPHVKNHKSPIIANMQIKMGGTVGGVCAAKVAEAEVMVQGGVPNVFITNQVVTTDKIARLCSWRARRRCWLPATIHVTPESYPREPRLPG